MALPVDIRPWQKDDTAGICSWVLTPEQLRMISGDCADGLNEEILRTWCDQSKDAVTMTYRGKPVGFCTLTDIEYDYPKGHVEVCHLTIDPQYRRRYVGTVLLNYMRIVAADRGYRALHGRVVPENSGSLKFTKYVHWHPTQESFFDDKYKWFTYEIRSLIALQERVPC